MRKMKAPEGRKGRSKNSNFTSQAAGQAQTVVREKKMIIQNGGNKYDDSKVRIETRSRQDKE